MYITYNNVTFDLKLFEIYLNNNENMTFLNWEYSCENRQKEIFDRFVKFELEHAMLCD